MADQYSGWKCTHTAERLTSKETATESVIRVTAYWQNDGWTYAVGSISAKVICNGKTVSVLSNGSVDTRGDTQKSQSLGYYDFKISKTKEAQSISCHAQIISNNTYCGVGTRNSTATTISVPAITKYTVTYNANGGGTAPGSQTQWCGETLTLRAAITDRTGYTFKEWNTKADGSGTTYAASATNFTVTKNVTLYAIWTKKTYRITYNANGGTNAPAEQTKTHGVNINLQSNIPKKSGYVFKGWATSSSSTTVAYAPGATYSTNAALTLYAVWAVAYEYPTITGISVKRCDGTGNPADNGWYCKVSFSWTTFETATLITITQGSTTLYTNSNPGGKSGTVTTGALGSGSLNPSKSYTITITVKDSDSSNKSVLLKTSTRPLDVLYNKSSNAVGVGVGKIAESTGLMDSALPIRISGTYDPLLRLTSLNSGVTAMPYMAFFDSTGTRMGWFGFGDTSTNSMYAINQQGNITINSEVGTVNLSNSKGGVNLNNSDSTIFGPYDDDTIYLGGSGRRWKTCYAINGISTTSDRNVKKDIELIDDKYVELFNKLQPVTFRFNYEGSDRVHVGFISQDVKAAMDEVGISDKEFGGYCRDIKTVFNKETGEDEKILDENGNPEYLYSLRYAEFIALNTLMIQKLQEENNELKTKMADLEKRLTALEEKTTS